MYSSVPEYFICRTDVLCPYIFKFINTEYPDHTAGKCKAPDVTTKSIDTTTHRWLHKFVAVAGADSPEPNGTHLSPLEPGHDNLVL